MTTDDAKKLAADAWSSPNWKTAAAKYDHDRAGRALIVETDPERAAFLHRLLADNVSLDRAWNEINRAARERCTEAPKVTCDAVDYELRTYGVSQLSAPSCQRRLAGLSITQLKDLMTSLQQRRGQYPKVSDELLTALAIIYDARTTNE